MLTASNNNISDEIDAIIARAMAEYAAAKGIDVFSEVRVDNNATTHTVSSEPQEPQHEEIPANSVSVLVAENTSRFSGAAWYDKVRSKNVLLAGLGGIGSYVAFLLGRMHINNLIMYDDDLVEAANMSGQLYCDTDVNDYKVNATEKRLSLYSDFYDTIALCRKFTAEEEPADIMICGFDNMEARKTFYNSWHNYVLSLPAEERHKCLFIDGRLAAESFQVLCLTGDDEYNSNRYSSEFLFDDSEADPTVCSYKQTSFMANMIGSLIVNLFVNFCANECNPLIPRDLPFFTEYTAETMYLKVVS